MLCTFPIIWSHTKKLVKIKWHIRYPVESGACSEGEGGFIRRERKCCVLAECLHKSSSYFCQNVLAVLLEWKHFIYLFLGNPSSYKIAEFALTLQPLFHLMCPGFKWKMFSPLNKAFLMVLLWDEHGNHVQDNGNKVSFYIQNA